jgi:hypothetical protein
VAVIVLVPSCSVDNATLRACSPNGPAAETWIMDAGAVHALDVSDPAGFERAVPPADLFVLEPPGKASPVGETVADFKSYAAFSQAIAARTISPAAHWVMYDNEKWAQTPIAEQQHPMSYERLFAALAHNHDYRVILAPAQDLVFGLANPDVSASAAWQRYLALRLAAISAPLADIYEIQAQADELVQYRSAAVYPSFVQAAAAQARAANPHIVIIAGLSTQRVRNAAELGQDFSATRSTVAGYWLNIPGSAQPGPTAIAQQFLDGLPPSAPSCPSSRPLG